MFQVWPPPRAAALWAAEIAWALGKGLRATVADREKSVARPQRNGLLEKFFILLLVSPIAVIFIRSKRSSRKRLGVHLVQTTHLIAAPVAAQHPLHAAGGCDGQRAFLPRYVTVLPIQDGTAHPYRNGRSIDLPGCPPGKGTGPPMAIR